MRKEVKWKEAASSVIGGMLVAAIDAVNDISPLLAMIEAASAAIIAPKAVDYAGRAWGEMKYFFGITEHRPSHKKAPKKSKDRLIVQEIAEPKVSAERQHVAKVELESALPAPRRKKIEKRGSFTEVAVKDKSAGNEFNRNK